MPNTLHIDLENNGDFAQSLELTRGQLATFTVTGKVRENDTRNLVIDVTNITKSEKQPEGDQPSRIGQIISGPQRLMVSP